MSHIRILSNATPTRFLETTTVDRKKGQYSAAKRTLPKRVSIVQRGRDKVGLTRGLQAPSDGLDVEMLRKQSSALGLPQQESEQLVIFANLLAAQNLLSKSEELRQKTEHMAANCLEAEARYGQAEARCGQAEARYGQAEARYGRAEARRAVALERVLKTERKAFRLETTANRRYLSLVELRGSVNLRDELREILSEGSAEFVAMRKNSKQARPSVLEKWTYIFADAAQDAKDVEDVDKENLMKCCLAADNRLSSADKAAAAMVRIVENLDQRVHRSLPAQIIKRIGGIAIEESALLGTQDCKLIECVMRWAAIPCQIVSREEIDILLEQEARNTSSQDTPEIAPEPLIKASPEATP